MKMEVRCCCQPMKLLGWMEVPEGRREMRFNILSAAPIFRTWDETPLASPQYQTIRLPVAEIQVHGRRYLALRSEEMPIETLRKIPGFTEAR